MKINLVVGDNSLDVVDTQIQVIGQGLKQGRKQLIIVPDRFALSMENLVLQKLNLTASFDIDVVSFARFSSKVISRIQAPQVLSSLGATMVIEMLLLQHEKELVCFGNTIKTVAFASVLFDSIAQLKSCKISPLNLKNCIDSVKNKSLKLKLTDLALIYQYYEDYLSNVYIDSNNRLKLLCNTIEESTDYENTDVHFCNFDSITEQGLDVLKVLLKQSNGVTIGVVLPEKSQQNADMYNLEMFQNISVIARNLNIKPTVLYAQNNRLGEVKHILRNVMAVNPEVMELKDDNTLRVFSASNPRMEVEWLAVDIVNKVKNGARFKDFAINCANLESYSPTIKRIFNFYNIPFWADIPFNLQNTEGYKFLQSALDCVQENFQAKDVFRFVKNSLIGLSQQECEVFENVVNRYCLQGNNFLNNNAPKNEDEEFLQYLEIKQKIAPLFTLAKNIEISKTIAEYVASVCVFLEEMEFEANLKGMAEAFFENGDLERNSITRQNFNKIDNIFTQMRDIMGQMECDFAEFNKIWKTGAATVTISALPMSLDCVYVGQSLQSVFNEVEHYYILGAIEGDFPAWVADVGLIADSDINMLGANSVQISPTIRQVNARSRFKTLQSFCYANKTLTILFPLNKGGEECKPASVIESLLSLFTFNNQPFNCIQLNSFLNDDSAFGGQAKRFGVLWPNKNAMLNGLLDNIDNEEINPKILATTYQVLKEKDCNDLLQNIENLKNSKTKIANLTNPNEIFFTEDKAGVTQIEKFFECPYAHFLTYGLKLKEKKTARIEAVDVGNILHAVLERFGRLIRSKGVQQNSKIAQIVSQIFDEVMQYKQFEYIVFAGHNNTLIDALKAEAVHACEAINYQMQHSQYKIKFVEAKFGDSGFVAVPEIAVINTKKRVKISGKIDRADIFGNRLRIIDYKTSKRSADFKLINFYLGKKIQLFYYMQVILNNLNMQAGGAYYLPVHKEYLDKAPISPYSSFCMQGVTLDNSTNLISQDDQIDFEHNESDIIKVAISKSSANVEAGEFVFDKRIGLVATEEQFNNLLNYAKNVLEGAINDIYNGEIEPKFLKDACVFCKYKNICRVGVLIEKKIRSENFEVKLETFDFKEK